jgi:hypothetical protein
MMSTTAGERLVRSGTALAAAGRLAEAAREFQRAAAVHRRAGRADDEVRCLVLLAQCRRLAGNVTGAATALDRAGRLAPADAALDVERAEIEVARGDLAAAVAALDRAIGPPGAAPEARAGAVWTDERSEEGRRHLKGARARASGASANVTAASQLAALARRRGMIQAARGNLSDADRDLATAAALLADAGQERAAARVLVERATALQGRPSAAAAVREAHRAVEQSGDRALAGELDLLDGAAAVTAGRLSDAEALCRSAREHALSAVEPTLYVGASLALSRLADLRGDPVGAYEAIAVGWATLADLIGREGAAAVFQPHLAELEQQWGASAFAAARNAYEDRRRAELAGH